MKKIMNPTPAIILLTLLLAACAKQEGFVFDNPLGLTESDTTSRTVFYPVNEAGPSKQGLLARLTSQEGDTALVFGMFRDDERPGPLRSLAYLPQDSDTILHVFFDDNLLVRRIANTLRDGRKGSTLLDIDDYYSYSCVFSMLSSDWSGRPAQVEGRWRVDRSLPVPAPLPVFVRSDCGPLNSISAIDWASELVAIMQTIGDLLPIDPALLPTRRLLDLQALVAAGCRSGVINTEETPAPRPFFPDDAMDALRATGNACYEHSGMATTFSVTTDADNNVFFLNVEGGKPPYSYAVNNDNFRSQPRVPGPIDPAVPHLVMVKDANACISSRIARIGQPQDLLCARLCGSTWEVVEASAEAPTEGRFIEGACDLLGSGCPRWREDRCSEGSARTYVAEVLQLQSMSLAFGNDGSGSLDYGWRRSERQRLDFSTCTLNQLVNLQEDTQEAFYWYARTPELLILYTAEGPIGQVNITDEGLLLERYFPEERETYRFRFE